MAKKDAKQVKNKEQEVKAVEVVETPIVEAIAETPSAGEAVAKQTEATETTSGSDDKTLAKAGKRSAKSLKEAEEKQAKEERKAHHGDEEAEAKPKQPVKPARSRLERRGKNFRQAAEKIEKGKVYSLVNALKLATETSPVKFDATLEMHINLAVDPRHADQNIRDNLVLPAGTGKTVRVAVFADEEAEGADLSGTEAILKALEKGEVNFDILIATPANMPKLGKYARLLGPRGLMPNPKSGTVTPDVSKAVKEAKAGRVEYRVDSTGIVHIGVGKVSFGPQKLEKNARMVLQSIKANKPASVKGTYVKAIHLATTMGPSIKVENSEL